MGTTTLRMMEHRQTRCAKCNKLLFVGEALDLVIKCPRCGAFNHVRAASPVPEPERPRMETRCGCISRTP
jgi:phage FluMu protein Com